MSELVLSIDFDMVVIDHTKARKKKLAELGLNLEDWQVNSNFLKQIIGIEIYRKLTKSNLYREDTLKGEIFAGAFETLKVLRSQGVDIFIVSGRDKKAQVFAWKWLKRENFCFKTMIEERNIIFCEDEKEKAEILQNLGAFAYIDDKVSTLESLPGSLVRILFDPLELVEKRRLNVDSQILVAKSWNDIERIVIGLRRQK